MTTTPRPCNHSQRNSSQKAVHQLLFGFLFGLTLCCAHKQLQADSPKVAQPNVLLIITDDQGYGDVGFHGNEMIQTPTLDAFAKQSLRLTNFHVEPTCAETRSALMSGQYPLKVGVWHTILGRSIMKESAKIMPQYFAEAGYRTGMFGKWHLGDNAGYRPHDRGFDVTLHHGGGGVGQTPDIWGNDYFDDVYLSGNKLTPSRGYCTDVFFSAAKDFIKSSGDEPFFCYLATNAPHGPYLVEEKYKKPYLDRGVPEQMASFYGMITNIDDNLKSMLAMLEEQDLARETIVVFMTDNGTAAGFVDRPPQNGKWSGFNSGMRGRKGSQFDGGHRVPCFIRLPDGRLADTEFGSLTAHIDLLPTLTGLCGIDTSSEQELDGVDLMAELQSASERAMVVQSHRVESPVKFRKSAVMTDQWRLVDGEQLFDMQEDPGQRVDVAQANPQIVEQLRNKYDQWWATCDPNPDEYSRIHIGSQQEPITRLTGHDWHGPRPPWNQNMVRAGRPTNGTWQVEFEKPGFYQFLLARQSLAEPRPLGVTKASVVINGEETEITTNPMSVLAPITAEVKQAGPASFMTSLHGGQLKKETGAFFVYAYYLGQAADRAAPKALPEWLSQGDRVAWVGGTLLERAQSFGTLEAEILKRAPYSGLTFCNVSWSGDDVRGRARAVFGGVPDGRKRRADDLQLAAPSVVVTAYGMSEALAAPSFSDGDESIGLPEFTKSLETFVEEQTKLGRKVVLCKTPMITVPESEKRDHWKSIAARYNERSKEFSAAIARVAAEAGAQVFVIELPALQSTWFESSIYISEVGYQAWSKAFASRLFPTSKQTSNASQALQELATEANRRFFELHRPQNETYLRLFRKREQGNNNVEPGQYRPLLAESQLKMLYEAATK